MENEEGGINNIIEGNCEERIEDNTIISNLNEDYNNKKEENKITNNINNINIVNMIIEKDKRKTSNNSVEIDDSLADIKPKNDENNLSALNAHNKKKNYSFKNKKYSYHKPDKPNMISNYELDISSIKKFINFQSNYLKNENDIVETNKCLFTYINKHPEDKINPIYFYILKNYNKDHKNTQTIIETKKDVETKNTPKRSYDDSEFRNSYINTADTLKMNFSNKSKVIIKSRNSIHKKSEEENSQKPKEKDNNLTLNNKRKSIKSKKDKKENLHFKNDEELVNFVKTKFKEKNSYYLIELKNKSFITNINENDKEKPKEKYISELKKIKDDNDKMRNKNIKLKKEFEQIEKELKLINDKNKELKEEMTKKDVLIKKYEIKINENKNIIQNLKKNLSEHSNIKHKNKNILLCKKEIEFFVLKKVKVGLKGNKIDFKMIKIEKNNYFNFIGIKKEKLLDNKLSIINSEKLYFYGNGNNDEKIIKGNKMLNKNIFKNLIISKENNINLKIDPQMRRKLNKKFNNVEFIKNLEIEYKRIMKQNQILEISKNNNIFFEKIKNIEEKIIKQNLSIEKIYDLDFSKLKSIKNFKNIILTLENFYFIGKKSFDYKKLSINNNQNFHFESLNKRNDIKRIFSIENINFTIIKGIKLNINFEISKNEIFSCIRAKPDLKDILKIIKIDEISFIRKINIINKFKNLEIISTNISFDYKSPSKKDISSENTNRIIKEDIKQQTDIKNQDILNNLNLNKENQSNIENNKKTEEKQELKQNKNLKSERMNRAMDRIKRKNQSKVEAELAKSESLQTIMKIHSKGRSETVRYAKSGKIMDIAKKLEMQMGKGDSENSNKIIENKDENSNIVEIVSAQPIIKKKKKNKIIFNYED